VPDRDPPEHFVAEMLWSGLLKNRGHTLRALRERQQDLTAHDWLIFQTVCTDGFDPFLDTFKLQIMILEENDLTERYNAFRPYYTGLICFDEAQCELSHEIEKWRQYSFYEFIKYLHWLRPEESTSQLVAAGTSLQLQHFRKILEHNVNERYGSWYNMVLHKDYMDDSDNEDDKVEKDDKKFQAKIYQESKTVTDTDSFVNILRGHARRLISKMDYLRTNSASSSKYKLWEVFAVSSQNFGKKEFYLMTKSLLDGASQPQQCVKSVLDAFLAAVGWSDGTLRGPVLPYVSLFRGRIRWSTMFIERLLFEYVVASTNSTGALIHMGSIAEAAAKAAQGVIVRQLHARLD
jgi:hypothetical protein